MLLVYIVVGFLLYLFVVAVVTVRRGWTGTDPANDRKSTWIGVLWPVFLVVGVLFKLAECVADVITWSWWGEE